MSGPLFSIVTPTCGRPHLLRRAIGSVLRQTFHDFELIVVDDGGDDAGQVVDSFSDERIRLIRHGENRGVGAAYNSGMKASRGDFITVLDDDDEIYPEFLEKTRTFFQSAPPDTGFVWTGIRRIADTAQGEVMLDERVWPAAIEEKERSYIEATTIGNGFGLTVRRGCVDAVGYYREDLPVCEDTEYLFRLARNFRFATIPEILVKIHHHDSHQLTHPDRHRQRLELHGRILDDNRDLMNCFPELFYVHSRRIAELCYIVGMKRRGRETLLRMGKSTPHRISVLMDFICYECFGVSMATYLGRKPRTKKLLSRVRRSFGRRGN